ncbi:uncharacterized protein LOC110693309 [Chenopodium quinoa]|uniref:uncharacterized protein LOC110693309 n=1 Tax=Chenopodium quinoa TaxID=63459 RepID=UPI000B7789D2|nr:uncharacterized protein LOC110693309 [Chenopodium quinoa]
MECLQISFQIVIRGSYPTYGKVMRTKLLMSTTFHPTFHPATNSQNERTIQTLEDMLRACVLEYQGSWEDHLDLIEFSYNDSHHVSIGMAPFEAPYGRKSSEVDPGENQSSQDRLKSNADEKRRDVEFQVGERVLLKISPIKGIRKYVPDVAYVLEPEAIELDESLTYEERPRRILDSKVRNTRNKDVKIIKVLWSNHEVEEATWEAEAEKRKKYLNLFMVSG